MTSRQFLFRLTLKFAFYIISGAYTMPFLLKISIGLYDNFFSSSVSLNLDTLFLNWNTTFPAVTVCEIYNGEKIWDISEQHFGAEHDLHVDDFVGEIVFFRGTCTTCEHCEQQLQCPHNFTQLLHVFRSKCSELILNCSYTNKAFNCCDEFQPVRTEYGVCYAFNSNQARKQAQVQHANNRITGAGHLRFEASADIQLHVHPPIEVPFLFSEGMLRETVLLGSIKEIVVNAMEVHNHASVEHLSLEQRRCRFSHERTSWGRTLGLYEFYSFSTCVVECMLAIQLEHCNCTSHFLAITGELSNQAPMCDATGLSCLTDDYYDMLEARKTCDCMSSCEEPEYNIVYNSADDAKNDDEETTYVRVSLVELPSQRYVRRVTKNNLDLMISVGGIAGLFFNASLLRVIEMIFLLLEIRWRGVRFRKLCAVVFGMLKPKTWCHA